MSTDPAHPDDLIAPAPAGTQPAPVPEDAGPSEPARPEVTGPARSFTDVRSFVAELLAPAYARATRDADTQAKWCPHWTEHPAAAWRLTALWQAWEQLPDDDPDKICAWWLDRADATMTALCDPVRGPFTGCGPTRHHQPPPLPLAVPA
ncbi:MAG: DUF4913 domain-containing protein [Actinobacteria bacterium]|nr:DUF4913 domain-containing protein [Actinomycetota bacterium]